MRAILLVLVLAASSQAQTAFENLTPNYDGSGVWFSSPLRMKGAEQYTHSKMFHWDEKNGVRLYDQKPPSVRYYDDGTRISSTAYRLLSASVSADGGTVAVTGVMDCTIGDGCLISIEEYRSEIRRAGGEALQLEGSVSLSPNGRFGYLTTSKYPVLGAYHDRLRDLVSGQEVNLQGWPSAFPHRHRVANDGTVVVTGSQFSPYSPSLRLGPSGEVRRLASANISSRPMINDSATRLLYISFRNADLLGLVSYDIQTARETVLAPAQNPVSFDMSNDGSVIAYVDSGQGWTVRNDGSGKRRVTDETDTVAEVVLSGDGNFLFAVTTAFQIIRFDLRTSDLREIVPRTSFLTPIRSAVSSTGATTGGLYEFLAQSLPEIAEVRLLGRALRLLRQNGGYVLIQVPFDMEQGTGWPELVLREQTESPFVSSALWPVYLQVTGYAPAWYRLPDGHIAALHEDFSAPVVPTNPARPGEILHIFGTGFGLVTPQPETGAPAESNPLSRLIEPFACEVQGVSGPVGVLYAGLAPGWVGLYQFDVLLPASLNDGDTNFICRHSVNGPFTGAIGRLPIASH